VKISDESSDKNNSAQCTVFETQCTAEAYYNYRPIVTKQPSK